MQYGNACLTTTPIDLDLCESVHMCMLASLSLRRHAYRSPTVCSLTICAYCTLKSQVRTEIDGEIFFCLRFV